MLDLEEGARAGALFAACLVAFACGGRSDRKQDEAASGSGGTAAAGGSGGSGAGGFGGSGGAGAANGGTGGVANGGSGGLTDVMCATVSDDNETAFEEASQCDPNAAEEQCTAKVTQGVACGCGAFVNAEKTGIIAVLAITAQQYEDGGCATGVVCDECLEPVRGQCSPDGHCMQIPPGAGRSCKVRGVVYADGESDIPSPTDGCNTCTCSDGTLACTEIGCEETPCPEGQTFGQDCAECGAAATCALPEYDCFWPCSAGCADRNLYCVDDLCVTTACR